MKQNMEQQSKLKSFFLNHLPNKITAIESTWQEYIGQPCREMLQTLYRQTHNLNVSAGTYGYKELSDTAKKIDKILRGSHKLSYEDQEKITGLIKRLRFISNKIMKNASNRKIF
jgi:chemotaxis protein histidine kinase CheA